MPQSVRKQDITDDEIVRKWLKDELDDLDVSDLGAYKQIPQDVTKRIKKFKGHIKQNHTLAKKLNDSMVENNGKLTLGNLRDISQQLSEKHPQYSESTYGAAISASTVYVNRLKTTGRLGQLENIGNSVLDRIGLGQTAPIIEEGVVIVEEAQQVAGSTIIRGVVASVFEAGGVALASEVVVPAILMAGVVKTVWDLID